MAMAIQFGSVDPTVFFEVSFDGATVKRLEIKLLSDNVNAANVFLNFCTGAARDPITNRRFSYKGSLFHRVIPDYICQGGRIAGLDLNVFRFVRENNVRKHSKNTVSMLVTRDPNVANDPGCYGSEFFICRGQDPDDYNISKLNGIHVIIGYVISDDSDALAQMEQTGDECGNVRSPGQIIDCGRVN